MWHCQPSSTSGAAMMRIEFRDVGGTRNLCYYCIIPGYAVRYAVCCMHFYGWFFSKIYNNL